MDSLKKIKVVDIISPFQIILNCGNEDGVINGQRFIIYAIGKVIIDPDTGDDLETLEIVKGKGKIIHLQNKICTLESIEFNETPTTVTRRTSILGPSEETHINKEKLPFHQVQIGDLARLL
jgi:hypothetical protein